MVIYYNTGLSKSQFELIKSFIAAQQAQKSVKSSHTGAEIDEAVDRVWLMEQFNREPVGILWKPSESGLPEVSWIDIDGDTFTPGTNFFNKHVLWYLEKVKYVWSTGKIMEGTSRTGAGLTFTELGDALVRYSSGKSYLTTDGDYIKLVVSPLEYNDPRLTVHPMAYQRGGVIHPEVCISAYEAGMKDFGGTRKLQSVPNVQPITGGGFKVLAFTSGGTTAISVGNTITGSVSGTTAVVINVDTNSGSWANGDAAGNIYLKQVTASGGGAGTFQAENLLVNSVDLATISADATALSLTITDAETYANRIGTGFGCLNIYNFNWLRYLQLIEYGTFNLQNVLARGIVDFTGTDMYYGRNTNADDLDNQVSAVGTGVGTGTSGHTPFKWRNIENAFWGNSNKIITGLLIAADGSYRRVKPTGLTSAVMPTVTFDSSNSEAGESTLPLTSGYISRILASQNSLLETGMMLAKTVGATGSGSASYTCDFYTPPYTANCTLLGCGNWSKGSMAGPGYQSAAWTTASSSITTGAFYEYYPPV